MTVAAPSDRDLVLDLLVAKHNHLPWGDHAALKLGTDRFRAATTALILDDLAWRVDGALCVTLAGRRAHPSLATQETRHG